MIDAYARELLNEIDSAYMNNPHSLFLFFNIDY